MFQSSRIHPWSSAILERFGFETPEAYRIMERRDLFRWDDSHRNTDLSIPGDRYLNFNDMEWYQPNDLRDFQFQDYHKEGFIPFAHAGNGDFWCWYPAMKENGVSPVLMCPHDCEDADLYAPDFAAALFRHAMDYSTDDSFTERNEWRTMLKRYAIDIGPLLPIKWRERLEQVALTGMQWSDYTSLIASEFGQQYVEHFGIRWMHEQ